MGHARNYAIADAYARHARAKGLDVMFPIGWDSFGLPAEKAAATMGADPRVWTEANIGQMRAQLRQMDFSFDWERELATHEPSFYGRTQEIFVALMRAGLVYKKEAEVWWDPVDQTVLANEQVVDGKGWRSGAAVERRSMSMHWIATTRYAEEMAREPLAWSSGALADHMAWLGPGAATGEPRLRDWCVSRQRRWGTPVPAVDCPACGSVPMASSELPHGHEAMGAACPCPACGGEARKSNETLDTFFDSSWYFMRYPEQGVADALGGPVGSQTRAWCPVDLYVGGREHATMHLVYARFMSRALADCGFDVPREPFVRYMAQGMVKSRAYAVEDPGGARRWVDASSIRVDPASKQPVAPDGSPAIDCGIQKMSKSKLNGIDPSDVIARWGIDATRLFIFFAAPFEFDMEWDERSLSGCDRFAKRFAALGGRIAAAPEDFSDPRAASEFEAQTDALDVFAEVQFARHEGLNGLVAAVMKRGNEIAASFDRGVGAPERRRAYLGACRAMWPMAPSLARSCALQVDPAWTEHTIGAATSAAAASTRSVALQWEGRFVGRAQMPAGLDAKAAFDRAMESSPEFRARVEAGAGNWQAAVWVQDRALNGRARALQLRHHG